MFLLQRVVPPIFVLLFPLQFDSSGCVAQLVASCSSIVHVTIIFVQPLQEAVVRLQCPVAVAASAASDLMEERLDLEKLECRLISLNANPVADYTIYT